MVRKLRGKAQTLEATHSETERVGDSIDQAWTGPDEPGGLRYDCADGAFKFLSISWSRSLDTLISWLTLKGLSGTCAK